MRILLDTHVFLWFISGDNRLPATMLESIRDPENDVFLSVVSIWETIVKFQLGKLPLPKSPESYLPLQRERHGIAALVVDEESVVQLAKLPPIHGDPFDRLLICQALHHGLTIATVDRAVRDYPVPVLDLG